MSQFYIIEIKILNGEYEHEVTWAYDEDAMKARRKGESAYYAKLSEAAVSTYDSHSVTLLDDKGTPWLYHQYNHETQESEEIVE